MYARADKPHTRRPLAVVFVVVLLVSLCAAGVPASADSIPGGTPPAVGGQLTPGIPAVDSGTAGEAALLQTPDYPISCTGAKVIAEMTGGEGFIGWDVDPYGDLDGDGHMDIGSNAYQKMAPDMYRVVDVFSGADYNLMSWGYAGRDPHQYSAANAALGNIYGSDDDPVGRRSEWAFWDVLGGYIWIYTDAGVAGEDWVLIKTLSVPQYIYGAGLLTSLGDLMSDSHSDFAVTVGNSLYAFSGNEPYSQRYTVTLDAVPQSIVTVGDVDSDGYPDYAVAMPAPNSDTGRVSILSGLNGSEIWRIQGGAGDRLGWTESIANIGDTNGDGDTELLVASNSKYVEVIRKYSLKFGNPLELIDTLYGTSPVRAAGDLNGDGKQEYLTRISIPATNPVVWEWSVRSPEGEELARCTSVGDDRLGMASLASDSNDNGRPEFVIGVPTSLKVYAIELPLKPKKWTVMVYGNGDNDVEAGVYRDLQEMLNVGSNEDVNIVAQFDRDSIPQGPGDLTDTRRYFLEPGSSLAPHAGKPIDEGDSEANMGDPATVIDFVEWSKEYYPADRYMLIFWGHGTGLYTGPDITPGGSVGEDWLNIKEINQALTTITDSGMEPIDILLFNACLMGNIETGSQLLSGMNEGDPPYVNYYLASEQPMYAKFSLPYEQVMTYLTTHPLESTSGIAHEIVYLSDGGGIGPLFENETFSASEIGSQYQKLIIAVKDFASILASHISEYPDQLIMARVNVKEFENGFVDLYDYTKKIHDSIFDEDIQTAADAIMKTMGDRLTEGDVIVNEKHNGDNNGAYGISVYFPYTRSEYADVYDGETGNLIFPSATHWDHWIKKNWDLVDPYTVIVSVLDVANDPLSGISVTAYSGDYMVGLPAITDEFGQAAITLPNLPITNYRFMAVREPRQYWSSSSDNCAVPGCKFVTIHTLDTVEVTVVNSSGALEPGLAVFAYKDLHPTGDTGTTDSRGIVLFGLGEGTYRFYTVKNGDAFWSSPQIDCTIPGCTSATITITSVDVTVRDSSGSPAGGSTVRAFKGGMAMGLPVITDALGKATLWVPPGVYDYQVTTSGLTYWTAPSASCEIPYCTSVEVTTLPNVSVYVRDLNGQLQPGVTVRAINGGVETGIQAVTDPNGQAVLALPQGSYSFGAEKDGVQYFSAADDHCNVPGCTGVDFRLEEGDIVTVTSANGGVPDAGARVFAFNGDAYVGRFDDADSAGVAKLLLPDGDYRFRVDARGQQFWSGPVNHCAMPGCTSVSVETPDQVIVTVRDSDGQTQAGLPVTAFSGGAEAGFSGTTDADGRVTLVPDPGSYRFRAELAGEFYWSGETDNCPVPGCTQAEINIPIPMTPVVITSHNGAYPDAGWRVYVFDGETYTGNYGDTNGDGEAAILLPPGEYRFRVDKQEQQYWSGAANHCNVPDCTSADVATKDPVTVTVFDAAGAGSENITVSAYNGADEAGVSGTTDAEGKATLYLSAGEYRFRVDMPGDEMFTGEANHCAVPVCSTVEFNAGSPVVVTVKDAGGNPEPNLTVQVYDNDAATDVSAVTNAQGELTFYLLAGEYRFRTEKDGTAYWSGAVNHCTVPGCASVELTTADPVIVTIINHATGEPEAGWAVQAYDGETAVGAPVTTDDQGQAAVWLADGNYRFQAERDGTEYWSGAANHCEVPECLSVEMVYPLTPVTVTFLSGSVPEALAQVYAFSGGEYTGLYGVTDLEGRATIILPPGDYRFRADKNGVEFWSGTTDHCSAPACVSANIQTVSGPMPVVITVKNADTTPEVGLNVYAFNGTTYAGITAKTNASGQVTLTLPQGNYRFRADKNGTQFWSGTVNHCEVPGCVMAGVTTTTPVVITVKNADNTLEAGLNVYAFNGTTYAGYTAKTNAAGEVTLTLPLGSYRFRADKNGTQFWSGTVNHCEVPGCVTANVTTTTPVVVTVKNADNTLEAGLSVYAFNGTTYAGYTAKTNAAGEVTLTLPQGSYRFRADKNGTQFWSATANNCTVPGCVTANVTTTTPVVITVRNADNTPEAGLNVYAFNGTTYAGYTAKTNAAGEVTLTLPQGSYRFRADKNGTQFWSATANHCTIPNCTTANVTVTTPVVVTVRNADTTPEAGLNVYAINGTTYAGYTAKTNADGQVTLTLPQGNYRFRADKNGTQFWSGTANHCTVPNCTTANVTTTTPVVVTVRNADNTPEAGLSVYAFNGTTYAGYTAKTNAAGEVTLTLPQGNYRFRADKNGTQFWSGTANHCEVPGCVTAGVTTTTPVVVTVRNADNTLEAGLSVYAFNGATYAGYTAKTNAAGEVTLTLPQGNYRFRADKNGTQFWSGTENHCEVPGCVTANVTTITPVVVTVHDPAGNPISGQYVLVYDGPTNTGRDGLTNAQGQATFALPLGNYRFRAYRNDRFFYSAPENHCAILGCAVAEIGVDYDVTVTVLDANGIPEVNTNVQAYTGDVFAGYAAKTNAQGQARLSVPAGSYRFRMQKNGVYFFSGAVNNCDVPACLSAAITSGVPVTVTVTGVDGAPEPGLYVGAMDGDTYTGTNAATNAQGQAILTLAPGNYRFRVWKTDRYFYSGPENHCTVAGCVSSSISTSVPAPTPTPVGLNLTSWDRPGKELALLLIPRRLLLAG